MHYVLVAIEERGLVLRAHVQALLRELGDDCQTLPNVWILRTDRNPEAVFQHLRRRLLDAHMIVAELSSSWYSNNARSEDDCFEGDEGTRLDLFNFNQGGGTQGGGTLLGGSG